MAARSVHVAVRELFLRSGPDFGDLDLEVEVLARKRMVAVDRDHVAGDLRDGDRARTAIRLRMQLHADVHFGDALERAPRPLL